MGHPIPFVQRKVSPILLRASRKLLNLEISLALWLSDKKMQSVVGYNSCPLLFEYFF